MSTWSHMSKGSRMNGSQRFELEKYIKDNHLAIIARPNSAKTEIIGWDDEQMALKINVHARPEDNKANVEIIKFFTRLLKRKVTIKSGLTSKHKILRIG
jgi:uncharacterized protein